METSEFGMSGTKKNINKFSYRSVGISQKKQGQGRKYLFIGDHVGEARKRLNAILR